LVAEALAPEGIERLRSEGLEVDVSVGISREELLGRIEGADAVIIRSGTRIDSELIERAVNLKVIGRAGIGLDNIDLDAATRRGVLVVNAPQSNIHSAAEHTLALLLSMARRIPAADASMRAGAWERDRFTGVELFGKTLGVLGLGRIGTLVAQRAAGFGMRLVGYDPYVSQSRAAQLGIEMLETVEELCSVADFITIHLPKTSETEAILGTRQFEVMKAGVRIVNASRGGIIDEAALLAALQDGRVAGAALDVYAKEPPTGSPLVQLEEVVVTPHLAGSTEEAQTKAGVAIAEQVLLALRGEFAPYAVNVEGGAGYVEMLKPFIPLTEKLGRILAAIAGAPLTEVRFEFHGTVAEQDTHVLTLAGLKGLLSSPDENVTFVNAPILAKERGIETHETRSAVSLDWVNLVRMRGTSSAGEVAVAGSLVGKRDEERIVQVFEYTIDMLPERFMTFLLYKDVPGVIGKVGSVLGEADINIAGMQVSRENIGGEALMGLTVDSPIPKEVLEQIVETIGAREGRFIDLGA
ncbi:MAG TPA: phosphoglycerate dehydrogenase, partial [Actinomycetota bacterium]|nr:phosphoglycerate dehydrogenase [Actinomycetota bacterium]